MSGFVRLSHVAFLVKSVAESAARLKKYGCFCTQAERWEGEGTLEIYVGDPGLGGRLLLMEAVAEGAYSRAFQKRGAGLHHIAVDTLDLEKYIARLAGSGWLLHPRSLQTIKEFRTAYLARPGVPALIEVQEGETLSEGPLFISRLEIVTSRPDMFAALEIPQAHAHREGKMKLICAEQEINVEDFLSHE